MLFTEKDGDKSDDESDEEDEKDLELPKREPIHLRTDKKFEDSYVSGKELGK